MPCVLKCLNLRARFLACGALEKDVVRGLAVEWRIEVNEVYAFIVNAATKYREIVAVIEFAWQLNRLSIFCASRSWFRQRP
jgi:hypothetical protein